MAAHAITTLRSLETPEGSSDVEGIALVLEAIIGKAVIVEDCINTEAGNVECAWSDVGAKRRGDARRAVEAPVASVGRA